MSTTAGSKFSLWDGSIHGVNKEISPTRIVQDWQEDNWEIPSSVTFHISPKGTKTVLELRHEGIPDKSFKSISSGWDVYYIGPLKELLEG
jgi:activator of HSP90 ATPase